MKISIIIPVYDVELYIEECLKSVYKQTYDDIEIIIVDDCGSDNSISIAKSVSEQFNDKFRTVFLHHENNRGLSAARNTGTVACSGDYIYYLDSDDYITEDCIANLVALAKKYHGVDIVQGNIYRCESDVEIEGEFSESDFPEYSCDKEWIFKSVISDEISVTAWNKLMKREFIFGHHLLFKEGIVHEDIYWILLASDHINSIAFCFKPSYYYRCNELSITNVKYKDRSLISYLMILEDIILSPPPHFIAHPSKILRLVKIVLANKFELSNKVLYNIEAYKRVFRQVMWKLIKSDKVSLRNRLGFAYVLLPSYLIRGIVLKRLFDFWKY